MIKTTGVTQDTVNGGVGFEREEKSRLFIGAVSQLSDRGASDTGIRELVRNVALDDPAWVMRFDRWLRDEANIRTLTIQVACDFVKARLDAGVEDESHPGTPGMNRTIINVACARADEPSKVIEYWHAHYGRRIPKPVKRGVADAAARIWNERNALKYDTGSLAVRFGDVIELTHPTPAAPWQGALFDWLLSRRHGVKPVNLAMLPIVASASTPADREQLLKNPALLAARGMTWENLAGLGKMDARAWEAVIPSMGYMALLRNLRNFDQVGLSPGSRALVAGRLMDKDEVARSRQFPFRFYSAYKEATPEWHDALETALGLSLANVPSLSGRTLIMVDCSGSMYTYASSGSKVQRFEQAALFGTALASRAESALLLRYGTSYVPVEPSGSILNTVQRHFTPMGGTDTARCLSEAYRSHGAFDRVVIITDEQTSHWRGGSVGDAIPVSVPLYTWNLGGHVVAHTEASPTRYSFGGLTDQAFRVIPLIEAGHAYDWPF